ncbi:MAG: glycoside hydrolase family 15 protein [Epsilonproteobacteria bacterium]|nr:glycoside hydrolase family 15 protein [Campylobacterota bacterium]
MINNKILLNLSLENHFHAVDKIILSRQDPITGLLPASTAVTAHGDYTDAWVRDNVYSILCVWGLSLSYRKHNADNHRSYVLHQSTVKLMRGLLAAMMRQSSRVEAFKQSLNPIDALHAKYGTSSGLAVVGDDEWGHLQLDATSLYLLMIAQMTASGLRIIYTMDEVNFIQNLVHYVSRTYCAPDFGIWERGNKINHGSTEINCSSVGMAKAALEALDGFNLFGNIASQEAVIHVIHNDIARSRFTLHGLLPRESNSKESDSALLSIIGYPAYAVEDKGLVDLTREKIIHKLAGNYGCKRFLLDGHQSSIEDPSRLYYEPSELREFENIESEWPLFFAYLLLDAVMREDADDIKKWQNKLKPLFVEEDGFQLLPELYSVPKELIAAEKLNPGSQARIPNENVPLVWAQSLYLLSAMITDGILRPSDIDPLRRRERIGHNRVTHPMVAVLAENEILKQELLNLGFNSETLDNVKPIRVMHASKLAKFHTLLGQNKKLGLSGRPFLVARTITTSRLHLLAKEEIVFLPYYFNPKGFYFTYDNKLLVEYFRSSLKFLAMHWDQPGQPIVVFMIREDMLYGSEKDVVLELLNDFQKGECDSTIIKTGPLGQLLTTASVERMDYIQDVNLHETPLEYTSKNISMFCSVTKISQPLSADEIQRYKSMNDALLIEEFLKDSNRQLQANLICFLWERHGSDYEICIVDEYLTLSYIVEELYQSAMVCHDWSVVRRMADLARKSDDRLEDALLDIVIRQKRIAVGRAYNEKATFSKPFECSAIVDIIYESCGDNPAERVITQEIMLHLGHIIRIEPELFSNMITLRTWYFVQLLVGQISRKEGLPIGESYEILLSMTPHTIYNNLRIILKSFTREVTQLVDQENLHVSGIPILDVIRTTSFSEAELTDVDDWRQWRLQMGMMGGISPSFYNDVWYLLRQCQGLVIGDKYSLQSRIGSELTLESTPGEQSFALRIDELLQGISASDYRQLNIEMIESLCRLWKANSEFHVENDIVLDVLIGHAVRLAWQKNHSLDNYDEERPLAWEALYKLSPLEVDKIFIETFMYLLTVEETEKQER